MRGAGRAHEPHCTSLRVWPPGQAGPRALSVPGRGGGGAILPCAHRERTGDGHVSGWGHLLLRPFCKVPIPRGSLRAAGRGQFSGAATRPQGWVQVCADQSEQRILCHAQ